MIIQLFKKATHFIEQPLFIKLWFFPLWIGLGVSKLFIVTLSIARFTSFLGSSLDLHTKAPHITQLKEATALQIGAAIRLAARYTPWDSNCFPQAILARLMLRLYRIPHVLYFGLNRHHARHDLNAHAWVVAGQVSVTGGALSFNQYTVVGAYLGLKATS